MFKRISQVVLALSLVSLSQASFAKEAKKNSATKESRKVATSGGRVGSSGLSWSLPASLHKDLSQLLMKIGWLTVQAKHGEVLLDTLNCNVSVAESGKIGTTCVGSSGEWSQSKSVTGADAQKLINIILLMNNSTLDKTSEPGTTYISINSLYCRSLEGLGENNKPSTDYKCSETGPVE